MELVEYLESTFNHKKLRNSRKRRNLSIAEVSEKTGIPAATLQKYESGIIKKIPLETLKKISDVYGTDYGSYYGWTCFPLYGTFSGLALSFLYGFSYNNTVQGLNLGFILGFLGMKGAAKYFEAKKGEKRYQSLYNKLTEEEKKYYKRFKNTVANILNSEDYFSEDELKEEEIYLLSYFFGHKLKKEFINNTKINPYIINEVEILDDKNKE
ncbi:MAG: helix-turn-helix domain-containing protein [Fusobacterium sp.]|uniref:helix-turn-helix domain-containing protein n=1 Tax=Fusobacterium sp. TaxID=68766 RepID=UPI0039943A44